MTDGIDDDPPEGNEQDHENRELVERFFAASEHGDLAALERLVDDGMVMEWPPVSQKVISPPFASISPRALSSLLGSGTS